MEVNTLSIIIYVLVPILTAVLGGWVGAYFGNKYREDKESHEKEIVRNIAIKALNILKSYTGKTYREAEGEFNKSMSIAEKRTVVVALHKLGIHFGVPSNDESGGQELLYKLIKSQYTIFSIERRYSDVVSSISKNLACHEAQGREVYMASIM